MLSFPADLGFSTTDASSGPRQAALVTNVDAVHWIGSVVVAAPLRWRLSHSMCMPSRNERAKAAPRDVAAVDTTGDVGIGGAESNVSMESEVR